MELGLSHITGITEHFEKTGTIDGAMEAELLKIERRAKRVSEYANLSADRRLASEAFALHSEIVDLLNLYHSIPLTEGLDEPVASQQRPATL